MFNVILVKTNPHDDSESHRVGLLKHFDKDSRISAELYATTVSYNLNGSGFDADIEYCKSGRLASWTKR